MGVLWNTVEKNVFWRQCDMASERRESYRKYWKTRKNLLIACGILSMVLLVLICVVAAMIRLPKGPNGVKPTQMQATLATVQQLEILSTEEKDGLVKVSTSYADFSYPAEFAELIHIEIENHGKYATIHFTTTIGGEEKDIYTFYFNREAEFKVGVLQMAGESCVVNAVVYEPDGIAEEDLLSYYAAQETFNDVMMSLSENKGFVPEQ